MDNMITRRTLLAAGAAAPALLAMPQTALAAKPMKLAGGSTIQTLSDGNLQLPVSLMLGQAPLEQVREMLGAAGHSKKWLQPHCNVTYLQKDGRHILFDAGSGKAFQPTSGKLESSMSSAGVSAEDITDIIFTHAHPDHIWGVMNEFEDFTFPNARYYLNQIEWDYWSDDGTIESVSLLRRPAVMGARRRLYFLRDRINLFSYDDEVLPGIEAFDTAGHTPGHTSFVIHEGGESVMITGDAATNVVISFAKPDWPINSDHDTLAGALTRAGLFERLVSDKMRVIGFHMPRPGFGRVETYQGAYRFVPGWG